MPMTEPRTDATTHDNANPEGPMPPNPPPDDEPIPDARCMITPEDAAHAVAAHAKARALEGAALGVA